MSSPPCRINVHVAREASFEAKAREQSPAGVGGRRVVVFAGERGIAGVGSRR